MVLRRPPLGNVLQSAHDMGREHRIISALFPTAVPVPEPLAFCDDLTVNDAPFYVMALVEGVVLETSADAERELPEPSRGAVSRALIDVLADLHAVVPEDVGLGDLGRHDGYVERQLRRWHTQFQKSRSRDIPAIDEVHARLSARVPTQQRVSIAHGDYRLGNTLVAADGTVRAVLDWELCTLGDPLADLGWFMAWWPQPGESATHLHGDAPSLAPGFAGREELTARYAERTGLDVSDLDYYVALALWKLACISEGVHARYRAGVMGDHSAENAADFGERVFRLSAAALAICDQMR